MMKKNDNLMTVHNYALLKKKSTTWIYKLIEGGKLKSEIIDGVIFVVVNNKK